MTRKIAAVLLSALLVLTLTACQGSGQDMTAEEIQAQLEVFTGEIPSAETDSINLTQASTGYSAAIDMTWNEKVGRFSTEKALEQYSRDFAASVSRRIGGVTEVSLSWMVPYHSETEPSMVLTYRREDDVLEQSDIQDRFTDGTFGADAYAEPGTLTQTAESVDAEASPKTRAAAEVPPLTEAATENLHLPHHKVVTLPRSLEPRHKAYRASKSLTARHKNNRLVLAQTPTEETQPTAANLPQDGEEAVPLSAQPQDTTPAPAENRNIPAAASSLPGSTVIYVSEGSNIIHHTSDCSGMDNDRAMTLNQANTYGFEYCENCW